MIFMYMLMIKNLNNMNYIYPKKIELNKSNPDFNYAIESEEHSKDQIDNYFTNI